MSQQQNNFTNRIFASFNTLFSRIVNKPNASIIGPTKTLTGEFPEQVTFERLYEFYNGWPQIKRSIDVEHQKFMGAGIKINSNNERFNEFTKMWWETVNADDKLSDFFLSTMITGNGLMERQFTDDGKLGNIEHIPMQTIFRIFRDQFGNDLKLVQVVDGVFKEIDPQYYMRWAINNPDRQAFGKGEFHSLAAPRKVTNKVDPMTGEPQNPERTMVSLLDAQAKLQNAEVEIKEKMSKPRVFASFPGMPSDQLQKLEKELDDPNSSKYIWAFNKEAKMAEAQIMPATKFDKYGENVDNMISLGSGFPEKIITNPGGFSYASSQTPMDVMDQHTATMQVEASELIKDQLLRPLADTWGFDHFDDMEVEVTFMPSVRRLRMEEILAFPDNVVPPEEKREMLKQQQIPLDDEIFNGVMAQQQMQQQQQFKLEQDKMTNQQKIEDGRLELEKQKVNQPDGIKTPKTPSISPDDKSPFDEDRPVPTVKNVKTVPNVREMIVEAVAEALEGAGIGPTRPTIKKVAPLDDRFVPTDKLSPVGPSGVSPPDSTNNLADDNPVAATSQDPDTPPQITDPDIKATVDMEPRIDPLDPHHAEMPDNPVDPDTVDPAMTQDVPEKVLGTTQISDSKGSGSAVGNPTPDTSDGDTEPLDIEKPNQQPNRVKNKAVKTPPNNAPNPQPEIVPDKQVTTFPEQAQQPTGVGTGDTTNLQQKKVKRKRGEKKSKENGKRVSKRTKK
jgi:hypothetical protein